MACIRENLEYIYHICMYMYLLISGYKATQLGSSMIHINYVCEHNIYSSDFWF